MADVKFKVSKWYGPTMCKCRIPKRIYPKSDGLCIIWEHKKCKMRHWVK